ncbi:hypothetical protein ATANTOWER_024851 [Ataeniobius toweri]|uniref:Biogenesis of lysosome-related organelles complex 1 subunit 7 n=1 Tax=Ataeniobius toweri TaxID=208326 RepID=A0ABU7BKI5_9TELE|nr:hypothetical protein [Ataeniobius toweri]
MAALNVNLNLGESEDGQSMGVLSSVLGEIFESNKTLSEKIDSNLAQLQTSINGVKIALDKVLTRVTEAENRISNPEDAVGELKQLTKQLKSVNELLKRKIDQLKNHSRRNNIRVVGLSRATSSILHTRRSSQSPEEPAFTTLQRRPLHSLTA